MGKSRERVRLACRYVLNSVHEFISSGERCESLIRKDGAY